MGLSFRCISVIDDEARAFESALRGRPGIEINLPQSCLWLESAGREFRLLQVTSGNGEPLGQVAAQVHRPRRARWYAHATAMAIGESFADANAERECVTALAESLRKEGICRLRTHFYRCSPGGLSRAASLGGEVAPPLGYERTLLFDLKPSTTEILAAFDKKVRAKILHRTRDQVEIRRLTDASIIPSLQAALDAAFSRTGGTSVPFDFEPYFSAAKASPSRVLILGLYLKSRPEQLLAYSIDVRHGAVVEAVSSGSLPDPELRRLHFNYFLFWEKVLWARDGVSNTLDMGGVTACGADDPLSGISRFKRQFTEQEATVNHERIFRLRPFPDRAFHGMARLKTLKGSLSASASAIGLAAAFAAFVWPLAKVGDPESPAFKALRSLPVAPSVAIIGDSRPHTGISPKAMLSVLDPGGREGLTAYNFSVDGTDALHHTSFARHGLLKSAKAPNIIVWGVNPLQFDGSRKNNRLEQLSLSDAIELRSAGAPLETVLDVITMGIFTPWRHRPLFATMVSDYSERAAIRLMPIQVGALGLTHKKESPSREYETMSDGHVPFRVLSWKDRFERGAASYQSEYETLELSQWHFALARSLAVQARESGTRLVMVEMPIAPWLRGRLARGEKHQSWRRRVQEIARTEGALFLDHSAMYDDDARFGDPGHMPLGTALDYSTRLAQDLKALLPSSGGLAGTL